MLIEELVAAIREKEEVLQSIKLDMQRIEKDIETLRAAMKILEREGKSSQPTQAPASPARPAVPETIRKAFP